MPNLPDLSDLINPNITQADRDLMRDGKDMGHRLAVPMTLCWFAPQPGEVTLPVDSPILTVVFTETLLLGYCKGFQLTLHPGAWKTERGEADHANL